MAYSASPMSAEGALNDVLRSGNDIICAGYCMYGSATDFVVTFGEGTHRFTLDDTLGEFIYIDQMKFPPDASAKRSTLSTRGTPSCGRRTCSRRLLSSAQAPSHIL